MRVLAGVPWRLAMWMEPPRATKRANSSNHVMPRLVRVAGLTRMLERKLQICSFEGVCLDSRHPGPRRVWRGGPNSTPWTISPGPPGESGESGECGEFPKA